MKTKTKFTNLLLTFNLCLLTLISTTTKAQDDANCGFLVTYDEGIILYEPKGIPYFFTNGTSKKQVKELNAKNTLPCRCPGKPFTLKAEAINGTALSVIKK